MLLVNVFHPFFSQDIIILTGAVAFTIVLPQSDTVPLSLISSTHLLLQATDV